MVDLHQLMKETDLAAKDCYKILDKSDRLKHLELIAEKLTDQGWPPEDVAKVVDGVKWILKE